MKNVYVLNEIVVLSLLGGGLLLAFAIVVMTSATMFRRRLKQNERQPKDGFSYRFAILFSIVLLILSMLLFKNSWSNYELSLKVGHQQAMMTRLVELETGKTVRYLFSVKGERAIFVHVLSKTDADYYEAVFSGNRLQHVRAISKAQELTLRVIKNSK
ncbi:MAG: hypothetical protein ABF868_02780 [Sporolactobacillus sp.]